ncbi:hypothetical protein [Methylobacterium sp. CM6247]
MSAPTTLIKIPEARALQLRAIATTRECTVTEAVEHLIHEEIKAGRLPDALPGFEVHTGHGNVCLVIGNAGLPALHPTYARVVAELFLHAANGMKDGRGNVVKLNEGDAYRLIVARKGRGIVGKLVCDEMEIDEQFSMTAGMARDFARQITKAADRLSL